PTTSARSGGTRTGSRARTTDQARGCSSTAERARRRRRSSLGRPRTSRRDRRVDVSTKGHATHAADDVMRRLRTGTPPRLVLRGYGSLVVGAVLFVLMLWLAPSVAPEH